MGPRSEEANPSATADGSDNAAFQQWLRLLSLLLVFIAAKTLLNPAMIGRRDLQNRTGRTDHGRIAVDFNLDHSGGCIDRIDEQFEQGLVRKCRVHGGVVPEIAESPGSRNDL